MKGRNTTLEDALNIFKYRIHIADFGSNFSKMTSFDKKIVEKVDFESILSEKSILGRKW